MMIASGMRRIMFTSVSVISFQDLPLQNCHNAVCLILWLKDSAVDPIYELIEPNANCITERGVRNSYCYCHQRGSDSVFRKLKASLIDKKRLHPVFLSGFQVEQSQIPAVLRCKNFVRPLAHFN